MKLTLSLTVLLLLLANTAENVSAAPRQLVVMIYGINDFHGNLQKLSGADASLSKREDPEQHELGGSEHLAKTLTALRKRSPGRSITVSAGDLIGASPLFSGMFHDEPTIEAMEALHLDVASVGNHEFDEGLGELLRMQFGGCHPIDGCYFKQAPYDGARFPWLAANVKHQANGQNILPKTWVKQIRGKKIGFIGMTLSGTPKLLSDQAASGLEFQDEVSAANEAVTELSKQRVKSIVLLLHEGGEQAGNFNGCDGLSGPIYALAKTLNPQIDVIMSGHTHRAYVCTIPDPNNQPRLVTSASTAGKVVTEISLAINRSTNDVMRSKTMARNVLVTRTEGKTLPERRAQQLQRSIIDKWMPLYAPKANETVGIITNSMTVSRDQPSAMGNLVADSMLAATRGAPYNATIAMINQGGVRSGMTMTPANDGRAEGAITYADLYKVLPFGNTLITVSLTGDQIRRALEQQYDPTRSRPQLILGISEGFSFNYDSTAPQGSRISNIMLNGMALQMATTYRVTLGDYLAGGTDGFKVFTEATNPTGAGLDLDAFRDYFKARSPLQPPPLRINMLP